MNATPQPRSARSQSLGLPVLRGCGVKSVSPGWVLRFSRTAETR